MMMHVRKAILGVATCSMVVGLAAGATAQHRVKRTNEAEPTQLQSGPSNDKARQSPAQKPAGKTDSEGKVPTNIMVLHATNGGGGIDPRLRHLSQLTKPPFSSYDTYRLLNSHDRVLAAQQSDTTQLPNGRTLRTELKEVLPNDRYQVAASISRPSGKGDKEKKDGKEGKSGDEDRFLPLLQVTAKRGEPFFVAGQSYRGGILVIGIQVGTAAQSKPEQKPVQKAEPKPDQGKKN